MMSRIILNYSRQHIVYFLVILFLAGCSSGSILVQDYSQLQTPQETVDFAKKAVVKDDPEAFYYCLSEATQKQLSLSNLKLAWNLAGNFFYLFLDAQVKSIAPIQSDDSYFHDKPMYWNHPELQKIIITSHNLEAAFLLYKEQNKWKLLAPSPYPLPDISKLPKKQHLPWRHENSHPYRSTPQEWLYPTQIVREKSNIPKEPSKPNWRNQ